MFYLNILLKYSHNYSNSHTFQQKNSTVAKKHRDIYKKKSCEIY